LRSKLLARLTCAALFAGCVFGLSTAAASAATLNGAGSTLVAPIEAEWAAAWGQSTGNTVNYAGVGSGTGYTDIARGLVDFGASDAPLSVYSTPPCANCVQIPWALTATGVSYRVDGIRFARGQHSLHLTGPVIAQIYLGQITNWSDPRIKNLNKGTSIPSTPITVLWRSDSSGDTYAFTRYLADVSGSFAGKVGSSTTVSFPTGVGARGNAGLASALAGTNGGIAYIAVSYLIANRLPAIGIKNSSGHYVVPNLSAIEAAATVGSLQSDNQATIVNPPKRAKSAYPISTFTYAIVPTTAPQGGLLQSFFTYAIGAGQRFGPSLDFAPLPKKVLNADRATIRRIG
jgi:phosphate transport system substrate-binding protein